MDIMDWDVPLPDEKIIEWQLWTGSPQELKQLHIPQPYTETSFSKSEHIELCVFSDASYQGHWSSGLLQGCLWRWCLIVIFVTTIPTTIL